MRTEDESQNNQMPCRFVESARGEYGRLEHHGTLHGSEILHQLRLVVSIMIYKAYTSQVLQDFFQQQYEKSFWIFGVMLDSDGVM